MHVYAWNGSLWAICFAWKLTTFHVEKWFYFRYGQRVYCALLFFADVMDLQDKEFHFIISVWSKGSWFFLRLVLCAHSTMILIPIHPSACFHWHTKKTWHDKESETEAITLFYGSFLCPCTCLSRMGWIILCENTRIFWDKKIASCSPASEGGRLRPAELYVCRRDGKYCYSGLWIFLPPVSPAFPQKKTCLLIKLIR